MSQAAVIGVGVGYLAHDSSKAAILIYMDKTQGTRARLPKSIDGVPLRVVSTDPFKAF
jgi:hypothetical protein